MQDLPMVEARNRLTTLPEELEQDRESGAIAITRHGKRVLAVMTWELYECLTETIEIMSDPELMAVLRQDIKDVKAGKSDGKPWDEVKKELGW